MPQAVQLTDDEIAYLKMLVSEKHRQATEALEVERAKQAQAEGISDKELQEWEYEAAMWNSLRQKLSQATQEAR
ncbi:MAG: hypothetical protein M3220_02935 [Chloroflexota bacterium]|nr:hypothetical protein [Chloroflexota bacterium]